MNRAIKTYDLGNGLTLVQDTAADCFENGWAILEGEAPREGDYEAWWNAAADQIVPTDVRVLAVLAGRFAGVEVSV